MAEQADIERLAMTSAGQIASTVIPEIPRVPIPAEVAKRLPQLADWYERFHAAMDGWRVRTNVAIRGSP
jgi:hypothetical protein